MKLPRIIVSATAALSLCAAVLYTTHPAKSSDHQDTYNLANAVGHNTSADITDVFVFPSPSNPNNVVLAMDVSPLTPAGMGASTFFDPTLIWQFKISHSPSGVEDEVIQFSVSGTGTGQTFTLHGPTIPNEVGTNNTLVSGAGTFAYNTPSTITFQGQPVQVFAGPRADPFRFDLFAFFSFLGDRHYATHNSQSDIGPAAAGPLYNGDNVGAPAALAPAYDKTPNRATQPSFNGFAAGTTSGANGTGYACSTGAASNTLSDFGGGFNVLSYVIELPKSLLTNGYSSSTIHVWATTNSSTTNS